MGDIFTARRRVEARIFDRSPDDRTASLRSDDTWNDVDLGCADDLVQHKRRWKLDGEHLSLLRHDGRAGPCAGAVDEVGGGDGVFRSRHGNAAGAGLGASTVAAGIEIDPGRADSSQQCSAELARVEAVLIKLHEAMTAGRKRRADVVETSVSKDGRRRGMPRRYRLQRAASLEGDSDAGELVDAIEEGRVEGQTQICKRLQRQGIFWVVRCQHACGGAGGLAQGRPGVEDGDRGPARVELERQRKADDAGACDADIGKR